MALGSREAKEFNLRGFDSPRRLSALGTYPRGNLCTGLYLFQAKRNVDWRAILFWQSGSRNERGRCFNGGAARSPCTVLLQVSHRPWAKFAAIRRSLRWLSEYANEREIVHCQCEEQGN